MKNIFLFLLFFFSFVVSAQCEINIGEPTKPNCGSGIVPILHKREVTLYSVVDCDKYVYEKDVVLDVLTIDFQTGLATSIAGIFQYLAGQITLIDPCPVECFIVCSRVSYKCGNNILWSPYKCSQEYAGVPVVNTPPTTVINPPVNGILPAPTDDDMGCPIGFISQEVTINGGGLNFTLTSFPADLVTLLCGQTNDGSITNIISNVVTDCGIDTDTLELNLLVQGGVVTGVNGVLCLEPPTTDIIGITGTVIDIIDTQGYNGGVCSSWITQTIDITTANGTYGSFNVVDGDDLCTILSQYNTGNVLDHNNIPVVITRNVEDCGGVASDTLNTYIEFNNGIIEGINGIACEAVLVYDCFEINVSNNFFDRWRVNGGSDIAFPSGNSSMGSVMNEMISTLPQTDVVGISVNPFSSKNFLLSSNSGAITLIEIYNTVLNTWEQFPVASFGQSNPCTI